MKLALCLFKYFPYGGLQRDFLRISKACKQRGHEIHVFTTHWDGDIEPGFNLHLIKVNAWQNHVRNRIFAERVAAEIKENKYDLIIGFNKMPNLDIYYAADVCYQSRINAQRGMLYKLSPRYRQFVAFEKAVFAKSNTTEIFMISALQQSEFVRYYQTEPERFHLLTPGIAKDRMAPTNAQQIREALRNHYQIARDDLLLLAVGSGFKTKGLDRTLLALSALPHELQKRTQLFVIGKDNAKSFLKLAKQLHIADRVQFLGGRADVADFLLAGDLLVHPAYHENTGTVLLEAMISGLPVLTVETCGYAHYVKEANAGLVLLSPFKQTELNAQLQKMVSSPERQIWQKNGVEFGKYADIYSLPEKAAILIEQIGNKRAALFTQ